MSFQKSEDRMSVFRHPHLTRGIVRTPKGAFEVSRGLVDVPDELGEALGWLPVDESEAAVNRPSAASRAHVNGDQHLARHAAR